MKQGVLVVYDRMNENSLLAAAVLKKFGQYPVVNVDQIDKITIDPQTQLIWLGMQPVTMVAFKMGTNEHIVFKPGAAERPVHHNVTVISSEYGAGEGDLAEKHLYTTLTELVCHHVLKPLYAALPAGQEGDQLSYGYHEFAPGMDAIVPWIGCAYVTNQFQSKEADKYVVAKAWQIIQMAYGYVNYDREIELPVEGPEKPEETDAAYAAKKEIFDRFWKPLLDDYLDAISDTKKLLCRAGQTSFVEHKGQLVATHTITVSDCHIYTCKRLINMAGQGWRVPLVILDELYYSSNKALRRAA